MDSKQAAEMLWFKWLLEEADFPLELPMRNLHPCFKFSLFLLLIKQYLSFGASLVAQT